MVVDVVATVNHSALKCWDEMLISIAKSIVIGDF